MNRVFLSFRKVDDRVARERVDQRLCAEFGREQVFKSGESIPAGTDYVATLKAQATSCPVMIVLMGERWLSASDEHGARLIDREDDWVRVEIRTALAAGNRVVPVLLGEQTHLPTAVQLPDDLAALASLQVLRIAPSAVDTGLDRLVAELKQMLPRLAPEHAAPAVDSAPPPGAQTVTMSGRSSGVVANGPVSGTVAGRDIRGNVVQGDHKETTVKTGGAATGAAALLAGVAEVRGLAAKLAAWTGAHKTTALISALVVVGGAGLGTAIAFSASGGGRPGQSGQIAALATSSQTTDPAASAAASPSLSASPSPSPTVTSGESIATSVSNQSANESWSDGKVLAVLVPLNAPTYFDAPPSQYQITAYSIATGDQLATYVPEGVDDGCVDALVRNGDGDDVLLSQDIDTVPAQGLTGGGTFLRIQGLDASTGSTLWTAMVPAVTSDSTELCYSGYDNSAALTYTPDGKFALETETEVGGTVNSYLVNLDTGAVTAEAAGTGLLGDWLSEPNSASPPTQVNVVNPGTGAVVDTLSGDMVVDLVSGYANASDTPESGDSGHDVGGDLDFISFSENVHGSVIAYNLPSGTVAWTDASGSPLNSVSDTGVDPETHAVFAYDTGGYSGSGGLVRFNPVTGQVLWKQDGPVFCGATDGHVYVEANSELVVLDEATGDQVSYNTAVSSCPTVEDGVLDEAVQTNAAGVGGPFFTHTFVAG